MNSEAVLRRKEVGE